MRILLFISLFFFVSCSNNENDVNGNNTEENTSLFREIPASESGLDFVNDIKETPDLNAFHFHNFYNGSGVAVGDLNNDGLDEIFMGGNHVQSRLYLNKGKLVFDDITENAGLTSDRWVNGVCMVDINNDGWLDIYVCNGGPSDSKMALTNQLYINNKNLSFTESASKYGLDIASKSMQANFADFDNDGDLDLYLINHLQRNIEQNIPKFLKIILSEIPKEELNMMTNMFYENVDGFFVLKSKEKGVHDYGFGLGACIADLNNDGWLDIYATNDFFIPDFYYQNDKTGKFNHVGDRLLSHMPFYSMGIDANDFNNDQLIDLAVLDMTPSDHVRNKTLMRSMDVDMFNYLKEELNFPEQYMFNSFFVNVGKGHFSDISHYLGVSQTEWSWAPLLFDIDNDGWKDYFVSTGYLRELLNNDYRLKKEAKEKELGRTLSKLEWFDHLQNTPSNPIKNIVFKNIEGKDFQKIEQNSGVFSPTFSSGAAFSDLDLDGDLDLVCNNLKDKISLLENLSNGRQNYVSIRLENKTNPASVLNAKVKVFADDLVQYQEYYFTRGYNSSMGQRLHFGLRDKVKVDKVIINYLDGTEQTFENLAVNQLHVLDKTNRATQASKQEQLRAPLMDVTHQAKGFNFSHKEKNFNDFNVEVLLPHKYSNLGPCLAKADINGDRLEDFYLGGSAGYAGILASQKTNSFETTKNNVFLNDAKYEDLGAHFFDVNKDGLMDLYVASGGGGDVKNPDLLQDRLYINKGEGKFTRAIKALPKITSSTAKIISGDFNDDGQIDLFVGGRNNPGAYPQKASSYLLIQNNQQFENQIEDYFNVQELPGMITGIIYEDFNGDTKKDFLFVSEWDEPALFTRTGDSFTKQEVSSFKNKSGWWQSVAAHDFDRDGDLDLILGNLGENNKFHPSEEKPLGLYAGDVDGNGSHDIVLTKKYQNKTVPVRGKECSTEQMPFLKEKFESYSSFANASINEILGEENLEQLDQFSVNTFAHYIAENKGELGFELRKLPVHAQWAPIKSMVLSDVNFDGYMDVFCAGNILETEPETTAYDAGNGLLLLGQGSCTFNSKSNIDFAGVLCNGNVTDMVEINLGGNQKGIIVANNNERVQLLLALK